MNEQGHRLGVAPPGWRTRDRARARVARVSNGVHFATWMSSRILEVLGSQLGPDWVDHADRPGFWDSVLQVDDADLWLAHRHLKAELLRAVRNDLRRRWLREGMTGRVLAGCGGLLDADTLTIGFVRRFATYKRNAVLFRDHQRLMRLVTNPLTPVQIVVAGSAHPADELTREPRFAGRIAFLGDAPRLTRHLVHGVDLWLNVPRTHGVNDMTAALNAVPELSTLDSWWADGFGGLNGWAIPAVPRVEADEVNVAELYDLLEREIIPLFYQRDARGVPVGWVDKMKHALRLADPRLTARRMVREHVVQHYASDSYLLDTAEPAEAGDLVR